MMIARVWRGTTASESAQAYEDHLHLETLPSLRQIDGFEGAYVLRREAGNNAEFLVLTLWRSLEAVRTFAGDDPEAAVVPDAARRLLADFDEKVLHYDVAIGPG
jgi:heme-degrading monooxygenase HmoA